MNKFKWNLNLKEHIFAPVFNEYVIFENVFIYVTMHSVKNYNTLVTTK